MEKARRHHEKQIMLRAAVCILYAHWEGFIKQAATAYISFVATRGRRLRDLKPNFVALGLRGLISSAGASNSPTLHTELISTVISGLEENANLQWSNSVNSASNLNSKVLIEILCLLGLDSTGYLSSGPLIDQRLLRNRNRIAHGDRGDMDPDDYSFLQERIVQVIEQFRDDVENAAALHSYLANPHA